jgi:hypothetical protein
MYMFTVCVPSYVVQLQTSTCMIHVHEEIVPMCFFIYLETPRSDISCVKRPNLGLSEAVWTLQVQMMCKS